MVALPLLDKRYAQHHYMVLLILVGPVFIDFLNGLVLYVTNIDLQLGVVFRGGIGAILLVTPFLIKNRLYQIFLFLLLALYILANVVWAIMGTSYLPGFEFSRFFKILYAFLLVAYFIYLMERFTIPIETFMRYLVIFAVITSVFLAFSWFTGIGLTVTTEAEWSYGITSFFDSQNDLGLTLVMILPMCMYFLLRNFNLLNLGITFLLYFGLFTFSTRTSILGSGGILLIYALVAPVFGRKQGVNFTVTTRFVILAGFLIGLVVLIYVFLQYLVEYPYLIKKFMEIPEGNYRGEQPGLAALRIGKRHLIFALFGEGNHDFHVWILKQIKQGIAISYLPHGRMIEMDYWDFIGAYGYPLGLLILSFPLVLLIRGILIFARAINLLNLTFLLSITVFVGHSYFAGHAMSSAIVASAVAVVYIYLIRYEQFREIGISAKSISSNED